MEEIKQGISHWLSTFGFYMRHFFWFVLLLVIKVFQIPRHIQELLEALMNYHRRKKINSLQMQISLRK